MIGLIEIEHSLIHTRVLPTHVIDIGLVEELKHELVVYHGEEHDEGAQRQHHYAQDKVCHWIQLTLEQLPPRVLLLGLARDRLGHGSQPTILALERYNGSYSRQER
mmetsp:Transcript_13136/g.19791  ORF Transcript_13136/g.19791 Transcript_13136/m.19791 type:complete len:106 (+) Transcript_13136:2052-2369(+)